MSKFYQCSTATFDLTRFPIITITCTKEQPNVQDIIEYKEMREKVFKNIKSEFILVCDISKIKWMDSEARIAYGKNLKESDKLYGPWIKEVYLVVPNLIVSIILKGINLVAKPNFEEIICSHLHSAHSKAELSKEEMLSDTLI